MGSLTQNENLKNKNEYKSKIPEYAREYKREWQYINGINKEFYYFVYNIKDSRKGLFERRKVERVKRQIKDFLRGLERGKLKDITNFEIKRTDVKNLIFIKCKFDGYRQYIDYYKDCYDDDDDDQAFIDPYPGFENIYNDFELFYNRLKIEPVEYYEEEDEDEDEYDENYIDDLMTFLNTLSLSD